MRRLLWRVVLIVLCLTALLTGYQQPAATRADAANDYKAAVVADVAESLRASGIDRGRRCGNGEAIASHGRHGFQFW